MIIDHEMLVMLSEVNNCTLEEAETLYAPDFVKIVEARNEEYLANKYKEDREYPPIGDQLDDLFKKGAFSDEMTATLQAVKDTHPKPE
jgi:hypothetical protein